MGDCFLQSSIGCKSSGWSLRHQKPAWPPFYTPPHKKYWRDWGSKPAMLYIEAWLKSLKSGADSKTAWYSFTAWGGTLKTARSLSGFYKWNGEQDRPWLARYGLWTAEPWTEVITARRAEKMIVDFIVTRWKYFAEVANAINGENFGEVSRKVWKGDWRPIEKEAILIIKELVV